MNKFYLVQILTEIEIEEAKQSQYLCNRKLKLQFNIYIYFEFKIAI